MKRYVITTTIKKDWKSFLKSFLIEKFALSGGPLRGMRGLSIDWRRPRCAGCDPLGKRAIIVLSWAYRNVCGSKQSSQIATRRPGAINV